MPKPFSRGLGKGEVERGKGVFFMTKELASDNGQGHSAISRHIGIAASFFILGIVFAVVNFYYLPNFFEKKGITEVPSNVPLILGIILSIVFTIGFVVMAAAISKTKIVVYKDRVEGIGLSKWFDWGITDTFNFLFTIEEISVEVIGGRLVVHGSNNKYIVYVKNGIEIRNLIFQLKNPDNTI